MERDRHGHFLVLRGSDSYALFPLTDVPHAAHSTVRGGSWGDNERAAAGSGSLRKGEMVSADNKPRLTEQLRLDLASPECAAGFGHRRSPRLETTKALDLLRTWSHRMDLP